MAISLKKNKYKIKTVVEIFKKKRRVPCARVLSFKSNKIL